MKRLGFVQADPIRAPARAQDLILRHRVKGYRAGDLERRYPALGLEEDVLYAYGFATGDVGALIRTPRPEGLTNFESAVLAAVRERGDTHPADLDEDFGRERVVNPWGGFSKATKRALEKLHQRGLIRVTRRAKGVRVYASVEGEADERPAPARFRQLCLVAAKVFAPTPRNRLVAALAPLRRRLGLDARSAHGVLDELLGQGSLRCDTVGDTDYLSPGTTSLGRSRSPSVRFLAPFDPVVWDRERFERFWGWSYRFEAYTPKAKRVRGYYALPLLWGDDVVGWANVNGSRDDLDVELGFVNQRPKGREFARELSAEIERMRAFLEPR